MGQAPKIIEELRRTREQMLEEKRQWSLNPDTGELEAEALPEEQPQARPQPVQVPRQTFD